MALSLLCGGLGVASAADSVKVDVSTTSTTEVYTTTGVDTLLDKKADKTALDNKADKATTLTGYGITDAYTKDATNTAITTKVNEEKNARELKDAELSGRIDTLSTTVDSKVSKTDLNTTLGNYYTQAETNAAIKNAVEDEKNARENAINGEVTNRNKAIADAIAVEETKRDAAITNAKTELKEKVTEEETKRKEEDAKLEGKITENTTAINNEKAVREAADTDLSKRIGTVTEDGKYIKKSATNNVSENLKVLDTQAKTNADNIQTNANNIKNNKDEIARVNGELVKTNDYFNTELSKTNNYFNTELSKTNNHFNTELGKTNAALQATNKRTAGIERTDTGVAADNQTVIEGKVHFDQNGNVSGVKDLQTDTIHATGEIISKGLNAGAGEITTTGKVSAGDVSTGTLETTGDATIGRDLTVKGILNTKDVKAETIHVSKSEDTPDHTSKGSIIGEGGHLSVSNEKFDKSTNITEKSELNVNEKGTVNWATSTDNATENVTGGRSEVAADHIKNSVMKTEGGKTFGYDENITADGKVGTATDKDGNKNELTQTATGTENTVTSKDGNKSTTKQEAGSISSTVYDKDGNVKASSEMKEDGSISNNATGDMTNTVGGKLTTTVTGQATENFKGGLKTDITGEEIHTVTGNQTNKVTGKQTNTVEGGQENIISGGQINNITGDQTTIISGTQTTTATDINRNASSSMVDKVDNAYGTNTETKVAGKTTTDVSIKGTGEEGKYIRGANESRDYLIKGTLMNSETKTAEATSTEITDGTNKASTIQKVTDLAGSVTNGKETGVSGIHAKDNSVSIDSIVTDGNKSYSVINQKKGSIQSTVVDGTSSTVILQDKDNVTIASSNGMVGIVGKDIVNNAQNTITNTAGTSITNQVNDSKVTTDANGTTFENNTPAVSDGGATTTKINGNQITTGRVDANELGVSDKDGANTADFSVKAGEGIKSSATDKDGNTTYTKVTATENSFQVQDKDGKNKNHQVNTKDKSENTITNGDKTNTVTSTADGTTFNNSKANTAFEGGTYTDTTIKGNTITTGKVTMDYAEVMKDLGVHGNAKVDQNLEVGGTSTLKGDVTMESNATVKKDLKVEGTTTTKTLKVTENATVGGTLDVTQKATFHDDVDIKKNLSVDGNATIAGDVTANSYKVGDKTYIDANGIHANGQKITDVADGSISEGSKDAVNGGQLYGVKRDLEHQVDKVGANAAAMANLRPMEFDSSSKWNIAAAIGNYGSETAAALGAFYRPNDDVMVNLSTAFGTGENMVGGGVSVRLGKGGNKLSREENNALKDQVNDLTARMDALLSVLNPNMSKDFPDVPENHWAYEAVSRLAGNDIVQGYPDGEFHGERTMTRYEMAEIIYNALSRGAEAERELVEEFKPELQAMAASEKATSEKAEG